jgi:phosphoribosylformylglycinamidine synthase subunit PurQ / glutaminase
VKFGIVVFPGSNCEKDCYDAVTLYLKAQGVYLWHQDETDLQGIDCVLLPGGFSYGDYLRAGAIAQFSPVMKSIKRFADEGKPVLGICNGFQVLTESGLLPGSLLKNTSLSFQCHQAQVQVISTQTPFTQNYTANQTLTLPIAHAEGNFFAPPEMIQEIEANHQVVFRYTEDVNGSVNRIAGICNAQRNVVGMMPHPERNLWKQENLWTGDGALLFDSIQQALENKTPLGAVLKNH